MGLWAFMYMSWEFDMGRREAGQAIMCWGGGAPIRRGRSGHHVLGWCAGQARPVRPPCAGGGGAPVTRGQSGHHVQGEHGTRQARPVRPSCA